jgi:hypothetical protein
MYRLASRPIPGLFPFLLTALALVPLLLAEIPPLVDYPNHIARVYVLAHIGDSPTLQKYYQPDWALVPNLAMDLGILALAEVMPVEAAGKLFVGLTLVLTVAGVLALSRAMHGKVELPAYLVFLFLYHRLLLWGYINFSFGIALALLGFALWLRTRQRVWVWRCSAFLLLASLLMLCHLFAFAVFGLFVGAHLLGETLQGGFRGANRPWLREWLLTITILAIPLGVMMAFSPTTDKSAEIRFGSFLQKLTSAFHVVNNYQRMLDYATFFLVVLAVAAGLATKRLRLAPPAIWPLGVGAAVQLVMPETLFGSQTADSRLPIVLWMLLAAGLSVSASAKSCVRPAMLGLGTLVVLRLAIVAAEWRHSNGVYREYLAAFENLNVGARVLSVVPLPRHPSFHHPPLNFIASHAVIDKSTFDPFLFAYPGHQTLHYTEPYRRLSESTPGPVIYYTERSPGNGSLRLKDWENPFRPDILRQYDYLLLLHGEMFDAAGLAGMHPVFSGRDFELLKISHGLEDSDGMPSRADSDRR